MPDQTEPATHDSDAPRRGDIGPRAGRRARVLPNVSLRTKIIVPMVALAVVPATVLGLFVLIRTETSLWSAATEQVSFDTTSKAQVVETFLEAVQQDLLFLSRLRQIRELAASHAAGLTDRVAILRREAEEALLVFSRGKRAYYQLRYLDATGQEIVRLEVENGRPKVIPVGELQDKSNRYYVSETLKAEPGAIYVSPMDLNVEHGTVQIPHRPVVRYGTPITSDVGERVGALVINLDADHIFSLLGPLPPEMQAWLTDEHGLYLGYAGSSDDNRRRYALANTRRLDADFTAEQVETILQSSEAVRVMDTEDVLLSFIPISLARDGSERRWTLIIGRARATLEAPIRQFSVLLYGIVGLTTAFAALMALIIANYLARPVATLRHTIREITAGNLSERVEIRTGDEIQGLATDFNTMMERLRQTQNSNIALEHAVALQATRLQRLQSGLAQADKLASIGQMTAGVMHEIGNPLASIKTKIQVAEEEGTDCPNCRHLSTDVLAEVDRLSLFLRSFSRLARMPEPKLERLAVTEIAQSVQTLVAHELQRRGVELHITFPSTPLAIMGDADQVRQLFINLILNATEARPKSGRIQIDLQDRAPSGDVCLEVTDDGSGIAKGDIRRIWDPFFTTKGDGTGLGLAICRQIVDAHHGTISVHSEENNGTVVLVMFPAAAAWSAESYPGHVHGDGR